MTTIRFEIDDNVAQILSLLLGFVCVITPFLILEVSSCLKAKLRK